MPVMLQTIKTLVPKFGSFKDGYWKEVRAGACLELRQNYPLSQGDALCFAVEPASTDFFWIFLAQGETEPVLDNG